MFEFSIALKYLLPRARQLSVSLIALLSIAVISLVVWLILVFLSVTEGIERGWLDKLTKLHAPLTIHPTASYYDSYYHKIDAFAASSNYTLKSFAEKAISQKNDPYSPEEDGELPYSFPTPDLDEKGSLKDPVKGLYQILHQLQREKKSLKFEDFEISGALLRLQLLRENRQGEGQSFLTQASYVASFPSQNPSIGSLIVPPAPKDIHNILFLASHHLEKSREDAPSLVGSSIKEGKNALKELLNFIHIEKVKTKDHRFRLPLSSLPIGSKIAAVGYVRGGKLLDLQLGKSRAIVPSSCEGTLTMTKQGAFFSGKGFSFPLDLMTEVGFVNPLELKAEVIASSLKTASCFDEIRFKVSGTLQGVSFQTETKGKCLELLDASVKTDIQNPHIPWVTYDQNKTQTHLPLTQPDGYGVVLAKSFQEGGVRLGDPGYLSYQTLSMSAVQEQRIPVFVAGFYDPGVLAMGNKLILVPKHISSVLHTATSSSILDPLQATGIHLFLEDLKDAEGVKAKILQELQKAGLDSYWTVSTFREYPFAKDLLEQFSSDKNLFTLIGVIILLVACCNIISLLILLVSDKKKEIGILRALGASSKSIACIFGGTGMLMGLISSLIGVVCAILTMHHIGKIAQFLSFFQGHSAFNPSFYGEGLPSEISFSAIIFVLIATPILSLAAGCIPALYACKLKPSQILRSE